MLLRVILLAWLSVLLCGCPNTKSDAEQLDATLDAFTSDLRWNGLEQFQKYLDPAYVKVHPPSNIEISRLGQFSVSGYAVSGQQAVAEGRMRRTATIDVVNRNTQKARTITVLEIWHYDNATKRWWLDSGLPDLDQQ